MSLRLSVNEFDTVYDQRNLQLPMVEIFKTKYDLNLSFLKQIFEGKAMPYNLF